MDAYESFGPFLKLCNWFIFRKYVLRVQQHVMQTALKRLEPVALEQVGLVAEQEALVPAESVVLVQRERLAVDEQVAFSQQLH